MVIKSYDRWTGSKKELRLVTEVFVKKLRESVKKDLGINLSEADMRKLFTEALVSYFVIDEIKKAIVFILDEEGDVNE